MSLPETGKIGIRAIAKQFNQTATTFKLSDFYANDPAVVPAGTLRNWPENLDGRGVNAPIPATGRLSLKDFYGAPWSEMVASLGIIGFYEAGQIFTYSDDPSTAQDPETYTPHDRTADGVISFQSKVIADVAGTAQVWNGSVSIIPNASTTPSWYAVRESGAFVSLGSAQRMQAPEVSYDGEWIFFAQARNKSLYRVNTRTGTKETIYNNLAKKDITMNLPYVDQRGRLWTFGKEFSNYSDDNGLTFTHNRRYTGDHSGTPFINKNIFSKCHCSLDGQLICIMQSNSSRGSFTFSEDKGVTWTPWSFFTKGKQDLIKIVIHPKDTAIYSVVNQDNSIGRSTDGGKTWDKTWATFSGENHYISDFIIHPVTNFMMVTFRHSQFAKYSLDEGETWLSTTAKYNNALVFLNNVPKESLPELLPVPKPKPETPNPTPAYNQVFGFHSHGAILEVVDPLYYSKLSTIDRSEESNAPAEGVTPTPWTTTQSGNGKACFFRSGNYTYKMTADGYSTHPKNLKSVNVISSFDGRYIFIPAATSSALTRVDTTDNSTVAIAPSFPLNKKFNIPYCDNTGAMWVIGDKEAGKSLDNGETWQKIADYTSPTVTSSTISMLAVHPDGQKLLLANRGSTGGNLGFYSSNGGKTWKYRTGTAFMSLPITSLCVSADNSRIFAISQVKSTGGNINTSYIAMSEDFGTTWKSTWRKNEYGAGYEHKDMIVMAGTGRILITYKGAERNPEISDDNGETWHDIWVPESKNYSPFGYLASGEEPIPPNVN